MSHNGPSRRSARKGTRSWKAKFGDCLRGLEELAGGQSFRVQLVVAALVIVSGFVLRVSIYDWHLLALCIAVVLAAEAFNTAIEQLAKAITDERNEHVRVALDVAAAAVLIAAVGAAVTGSLVLLRYAIP